jgi:hypothetical protein
MRLSAKITRNRIVSTLRWIGLAALDEAGNVNVTDTNPGQALARFELAAQRVAKLRPRIDNGKWR